MRQLLALLAFLTLVLAAPSARAIGFVCDCADATDPMQSTCNSWKGSSAYNGLSRYPGKLDDGVTVNAAYGPKLKLSEARTAFSTTAAGTAVKLCKFGKWPVIDQSSGTGEAIQNFSAANGTRSNRVTLGAYDLPGVTGDAGSGGTVSFPSTSSMVDSSKTWTVNRWAGWELVVETDTKYRRNTQRLRIESNTATTLTLRSGGLGWDSMRDERFVLPLPAAGAAYTIEQAQPEITGLHPTLGAVVGFNPGTIAHREGYILRDIRLVGGKDGAPIASMSASGGVVTVATTTAHGLTTGDLASLINVSCAACDVFYRMNHEGTAVTVVDPTHFSYLCSISLCPNGSTGAGNPTMFWRKVGLRLFLNTNDQDFVTLDNMTVLGGVIGVQASGGVANNFTKTSTTDGLNTNVNVLNSRVMKVSGHAMLVSGSGLYLYGTLFNLNGTDLYMHHVYVGGSTKTVQPNAMASVSGNGTTTTVTLAAPTTDFADGNDITVALSGASACSTSGTPTPSSALITVVDSTHFTYPSSCNGTSTGGTLTLTKEVDVHNVNVIRNTFLAGNVGGSDKCRSVVLVVHGRIDGLNILDNDLTEDGNPLNGCWGIVPSTGLYSPPASKELLRNVVVAGNRLYGFDVPIGLEICHTCLIANNLIIVTRGGLAGITTPLTAEGTYLTPYRNDQISVLNNTIYHLAPTSTSYGIRTGRDGSGHRVANNLIFFATGWTASSAYFCTDCVAATHTTALQPAAFSLFDYNYGYAQGQAGTQPKWNTGTMNGGALGNVVRDTLAKMQDVALDAHSSDTCDPGLTWTAPSSTVHWDLTLPSASCALGHPSFQPYGALFMRKRTGPPSTAGALDPDASAGRLPPPVRNRATVTP